MMKRRVILFGTLVGVCLIGFLTAVILSGTGNGTMAIVERTRNGDASEAKGLEITFDALTMELDSKNHTSSVADDIVWKNTISYDGKKPALQAEQVKTYTDYQEKSVGGYIFKNLSSDYYDGIRYVDYFISNFPAVREETKRLEKSENQPVTFRLRDCLDYYPLFVDIHPPYTDFFENGYSLTDVAAGREKRKVPYTAEEAQAILDKFEKFFRIPVLKGDVWVLKKESGWVPSEDSGFTSYFCSTVSEKAVFFTFRSLAQNGLPVDTSLIPGGYGIYCLPYSWESIDGIDFSKIDVDAMKLFCPLDPDAQVKQIAISNDGKTLYVISRKNTAYYAQMIDAETGEILAKDIYLWETEDSWHEMILTVEEDFAVVRFAFNEKNEFSQDTSRDIELRVLGKKQSGEWGLAMAATAPWEAAGFRYAFDGEKLAEVSFYTTDCLINVSVYSAEGLLYRGEIAHSYYPDSNQETGDRYPQMKILQCRWNR